LAMSALDALADASDNTNLEPQDVQVLDQIGDGVTSVVFKGLYKGMEVAVKEMLGDVSTMSDRASINLNRELTILRKVKHPNLVRFIGVYDVDTRPKIVTEFCNGGTAYDLLHEGGLLTWDQKLKILLDVSSAMAYLHSVEPPIVHRDLKSLNLLLQNEVTASTDLPIVKVTDFGLARMINAAGNAAQMTKNAGTCHWMAPEVFTSNSYDTQADVYSFSMIMFEVLCQDIPFYDIAPARLGLVVVQGHRPDMDAVPPDCPQHLMELMVRCWTQDASQRPDFHAIVEILQQN